MKRWLACAVLMASCRQDVINAGGYQWVPDDSLPKCSSYEWVQRNPVDVQKICERGATGPHEYVIGCSFVQQACLVVSMYDEQTAKMVFLPGATWSHQRHEVEGHIFNRWRHP